MSPLTIFLLIILFVLGCYIIITEKRQHALRRTAYQLKSLINGIPDLMWIKDEKLRFLFVNNRFCEAFALPREKIIGKTDFDLNLPEEQAQSYYEDDLKTQQTKKPLQRQERITAADGCFSWSETTKIAMFNKHKQVIGTAGIARDISKRKTAEQKIVQTIVSLAENFNLSVIAEGVETVDELTETNKCGINYVQGYYYSRPLVAAELEKTWFAQQKKAANIFRKII